jgi:hypothetical protein
MSARDAFALQATAVGRSVAVAGVISMLGFDRNSVAWFGIMFASETALAGCALGVAARADMPRKKVKDLPAVDPWSSVLGAALGLVVHYMYPIMGYTVVRSIFKCSKSPDFSWRPFPTACADIPFVPAALIGILTLVVLIMFVKFTIAYFSCVRTRDRKGFAASAMMLAVTVQCAHLAVWMWFLAREHTRLMSMWRAYAFLVAAGAATATLAGLGALDRCFPPDPHERKETQARTAVMWAAYVAQGIALAGGLFNALTMVLRSASAEYIVAVSAIGITGIEYIVAFVCRLAHTIKVTREWQRVHPEGVSNIHV